MIHEIYDLVLMTPQCGMTMLINIYDFYKMIHMRVCTLVLRGLPVLYGDDFVATRPLWTDLWRGRIWLDICCDVPWSWVVWLAFQPRQIWDGVGMSRYRRVAYLGKH